MNTPDTGAQPKCVRAVIWRCTLKCALFVVTIVALELVSLAVLDTSIAIPGWTLAISLIYAMGSTMVSAIRLFRARSKEARLYAILAKHAEYAPSSRLLHVSLKAALQADLTDIARRAGLANQFKLLVARAANTALAYVGASFGKKLPVKIYVTESIPKMGLSRREVQGIFAHEIGHVLLGSESWHIYILALLKVFSKGLLFVQTFCLSVWCGVVLVLYTSHAHFSLGHSLRLVALVASVVFVLALIVAWCLKLAFALTEARLGRMHEFACDKISALLVGPGLLGQALLKGERFEIKRGRSYSPEKESSARLQGIRNFVARLLAFHPNVAERVRRNVQAI